MSRFVGPGGIPASTNPPQPDNGKQWVDTSQSPPEVKVYDSATSTWLPADTNATVVSTSEPTPQVGKIWFEPAQGGTNMYAASSTNWEFLKFLSAIPDSAGKHYYLADSDSGDIEYYTLSTPYDLATRTKQFTFSAKDRAGIVVNPDGTRAIIYEGEDTGQYSQVDLTTPFDLSSATNQTTVSNLPDASRGSIQVNEDGSRLYITDKYNSSFIQQFDLSTPFDITTATSAGSKNLGRGGDTGQIAFNEDGSKLIFGERGDSKIYSTNLSVPFDITTTGSFTSFTTDSKDPVGIAISAEGQKLFTRHWSPNIVAEYNFGTPFDITTLVYQGDKLTSLGSASSHQFSINPFQV